MLDNSTTWMARSARKELKGSASILLAKVIGCPAFLPAPTAQGTRLSLPRDLNQMLKSHCINFHYQL
jgi:hypothetical protein